MRSPIPVVRSTLPLSVTLLLTWLGWTPSWEFQVDPARVVSRRAHEPAFAVPLRIVFYCVHALELFRRDARHVRHRNRYREVAEDYCRYRAKLRERGHT